MSTNTQFPKGIRPITLRMSDGIRLEIQAVSYDNAVLRVFNASGERAYMPPPLEIYNHHNKKYLDLKIDMRNDEVPLSMSDSYTIRYKGDVVLEQGGTIGCDQYPLSDEFVFPPSIEEKNQKDSLRYTALVLGSFEEGALSIKVSSTEGAAVGRSVTGQGIAEESYVMEVNKDRDEIIVDKYTLESASRITLEIR